MTTPIAVVVLGLLALSLGASAVPRAREQAVKTENGVMALKALLAALQANKEEINEISGQEAREEDEDSRRKAIMQHALKLGLMEMARLQQDCRLLMQDATPSNLRSSTKKSHIQRGRRSLYEVAKRNANDCDFLEDLKLMDYDLAFINDDALLQRG